MPFISTKVNITITPEKEAAIKEKLGEAITLLGKTESWLMLDFEDEKRMYFKGDNRRPMAFVEIRLLGSASASDYSKMTAAVTDIISAELGIDSQQIYIEYIESEYWGWAGKNF